MKVRHIPLSGSGAAFVTGYVVAGGGDLTSVVATSFGLSCANEEAENKVVPITNMEASNILIKIPKKYNKNYQCIIM